MIKLREAQLNRLPAQAKKQTKPDKLPSAKNAKNAKKHEAPEREEMHKREEAPAPGSMFDQFDTDSQGVNDEI